MKRIFLHAVIVCALYLGTGYCQTQGDAEKTANDTNSNRWFLCGSQSSVAHGSDIHF